MLKTFEYIFFHVSHKNNYSEVNFYECPHTEKQSFQVLYQAIKTPQLLYFNVYFQKINKMVSWVYNLSIIYVSVQTYYIKALYELILLILIIDMHVK